MISETQEAARQIRASLDLEATQRIRAALDHIQRAQTELGLALSQLASLIGCMPEWNRANRLYDQAHALWYRVERRRGSGKFRLDGISEAAFRKARGK